MKLFFQISTLALGFLGTGTARRLLAVAEAEAPTVLTPWVDECLFEDELYPCPSENSFCQDRRPDDFFYKCGCLGGAIPVLPEPDGTVMYEGEEVPSIDGAPITFRPITCLIPAATDLPTAAPVVMDPTGTLAPVAPAVECTRKCDNVKEECIASGTANAEGLYQCTCLPGFRKTGGGGCTDIKQCEFSTLNDCAEGAICVEMFGGIPGYNCVCPTGTIGGAFTECFNLTSAIETSGEFFLTLTGVDGEMDEEEKAILIGIVAELLGEIDGFDVTNVTIADQSVLEGIEAVEGVEAVEGIEAVVGAATDTNVVKFIVSARSNTASAEVTDFADEVVENLVETKIISTAKRSDAALYFAAANATQTVFIPEATAAPTAAPTVSNTTRYLLQETPMLRKKPEEAPSIEEPQAVFPVHHGRLPAKVVYLTDAEMPEETINAILEVQNNDIEVKFYDNKMVTESVKEISLVLEEQEGITGAYEAFLALKPWAYRSDLWRLMILWANGGIYIDADLAVKAPIDYWATLDDDQEIATCVDLIGHLGKRDGSFADTQAIFYQAMLSAKKGSPILLDAIRLIIDTVSKRRYGLAGQKKSDLAITGPISLGKASKGSYNKIRASCRLKRLPNCKGDTKCRVVQGYVPTSPDAPWLGLFSPITLAANDGALINRGNGDGFYGHLFEVRDVYCEAGESCLAE